MNRAFIQFATQTGQDAQRQSIGRGTNGVAQLGQNQQRAGPG